jgi:FkbM family methyltransferase
MHKKIGVESLWGFGNFLYALSLALSNIKQHNRENNLTIVESGNCGYDHINKKQRQISEYLCCLFCPKLNIEVTNDKENFLKSNDNFLFRGFNFKFDLGPYKDFIIETLPFSNESLKICNEFMNKINYKNEKKEYICINIRGGDFGYYYNKIDEILNPNFFFEAIDSCDPSLPIIANIIPKEETEKYKKIFKKYEDRICFSSEEINYPMFLPILAQAKYCIISNSTFYWWGAFLNKNGVIYYPDPWFRVFNQKMWMPKEWKAIKNENNTIKNKNKTIVHVGAHFGDEVPSYKNNYKKIIMIEADPDSFAVLNDRYKNDEQVETINMAVSDKPGFLPFYRTSNGQSSSLFELNKPHIDQFSYVKQTDVINVKADTLDSLINLKNYENKLVIDVQGAELKVLKGSLNTLEKIDEITLEINYEESYKGCCLMHEIDEFLYEKRFKRKIATFGGCQGEATYVRNKNYSENNLNIVPGWFVIFNSSDARVWLEESLPLLFCMKKKSIKIDKLKIETKDFCKEIEMKIEDVNKITPYWNGYAYYIWNSFHLGSTDTEIKSGGDVVISEKNKKYLGGTGFGRVHYMGNQQGYSVAGVPVSVSNFKISLHII